jgi:hypothetical protein
MQSLSVPEPVEIRGAIDSTVRVSMLRDHLVIWPPAHVDLQATQVVVMAAASAVLAGSTVMIDLDPTTASEELLAHAPLSFGDPHCVTGPGGPVDVPGAGFVRLATLNSFWTIDLGQGRLCRSDLAIDPHFVRPQDWTRLGALWVSQSSVTALTDDGTYLSTPASWSTGERRAAGVLDP